MLTSSKGHGKKPKDFTIDVGGELYFTVNAFARVTHREPQTIRRYIISGNRIRKLRIIRVAEKPLIPYVELLEFPFTVSGRHSTEVYHYDENGKVVEA